MRENAIDYGNQFKQSVRALFYAPFHESFFLLFFFLSNSVRLVHRYKSDCCVQRTNTKQRFIFYSIFFPARRTTQQKHTHTLTHMHTRILKKIKIEIGFFHKRAAKCLQLQQTKFHKNVISCIYSFLFVFGNVN